MSGFTNGSMWQMTRKASRPLTANTNGRLLEYPTSLYIFSWYNFPRKTTCLIHEILKHLQTSLPARLSIAKTSNL
jgi:hypothetical protein